jgi:hypothetical protein
MAMISKPVKTPRKGQFQKGHDKNRNMGGNKNAALQSYQVRFNNALAEKMPPEEFAAIVADEVRRHRPGAREFAGKHLVGEPAQKHEFTGQDGGPIQAIVKFIMPRPGDEVACPKK